MSNIPSKDVVNPMGNDLDINRLRAYAQSSDYTTRSITIYTDIRCMAVELLRLRSSRVETTVRHDVTCNYPRGPLYGPGCICMVVNKHVYARLEAAAVCSSVEPEAPRFTKAMLDEAARLADEEQSIFDSVPVGIPQEPSPSNPAWSAAQNACDHDFVWNVLGGSYQCEKCLALSRTGTERPAVKASAPLREPQPDDFITCGYRDYPAYKIAHDRWRFLTSENGSEATKVTK